MRKVRCVRGHFYDVDMNVLCPHCGSPEGRENQKESTVEEPEITTDTKSKKGHGIFVWKKQTKNKDNNVEDMLLSKNGKETEKKLTTDNTFSQTSKILPKGEEVDKTQAFWNREQKKDKIVLPLDEETLAAVESQQQQQNSRDIDSIKTVSKFAGQGGVEPVVGWLVCIKGNNYGKAFEIKSGQNSIGRDSGMRICIKEEDVTREKHAFIIFEPKKRQFFLRGGDGSGLTYCNEDMVTGMVQLNSYDKIQFGDAEFLFVPFCGEQYIWEEKEEN